MTEPLPKRADQLVVGDRILHRFLPAPFAPGPAEVVFLKLHEYRGSRWVFVAYKQDNGFYDATSYMPEGEVEVYPAADPTGQAYSREADGETTQPIAGRVPAHLEDARTGEVELVESRACPAHGPHPHEDEFVKFVCLDCPQCRPAGSSVD